MSTSTNLSIITTQIKVEYDKVDDGGSHSVDSNKKCLSNFY